MADPKGLVLPTVREQGSQASTSARSTPREPCANRTVVRAAPPFAAENGRRLFVPAARAGGGAALVGPGLLDLREQRQSLTLNDLPELRRITGGVCRPRPGKGTSGRRVGEAITAPELPELDLAVSEAMSDLLSAADSANDAPGQTAADDEGMMGLQRVNAIASEDEWAPLLLDAFFRPPSELTFADAGEAGFGPPDLDRHRQILHSMLPAETPLQSRPVEPIRAAGPRRTRSAGS